MKKGEAHPIGFRNPESYKKFHNMQNIVVGKGELPFIEAKNGWRSPTGEIIYNKSEATLIAQKLDKLYQRLYQSKMQRLNRF